MIMKESTSDLIITLCVIIGVFIIRILPKKIWWGWRVFIGLVSAIALSVITHLIVKWLLS